MAGLSLIITFGLLGPLFQGVDPVAPPPASRMVLGYLHRGGTAAEDGEESLQRNSHLVTHISPSWLTIANAQGTVQVDPQYRPDLTEMAHRYGLQVLPRVIQKGFRRDLVHAFLRNQTGRLSAARQLRDWLLQNRCHGLNLDFEYVPARDRKVLTKFVKELRQALNPAGLLLTMAVPAKTRDVPTSDWSGAFDYHALGRLCDHVILMAYDEHWATSRPGPVASVPFVERVLAYATRKIPREKLLLGLPFYGRDWPEAGRGKSWTGRQVLDLIRRTSGTVNWSETASAPWFVYEEAGKTRTVWFESSRSLSTKIDVAHRHQVGGLSIWRLGNEDPTFWLPVARYRAGRGLRGWLTTAITFLRNLDYP